VNNLATPKRLKMKHAIILFACVASTAIGCGQSPAPNQKQATIKPMTAAKQSTAVVFKLSKHQVLDREGTGMVASTYLLPADWSAQDNLYWEYRDPTVPIRYKGLLQNSDKTMAIQSYPDVRASWYTGPSGSGGYHPPSDILTGMKDLIKAERRGKNVVYIDQKILSNNPQRGQQQGSQTSSLSQTGVIHVQYEENGQPYEEEFYGQLDVSNVATPSAMGDMVAIIWGAGSLYSLKAPKGKLEECRKIAQTVKASARLTKPFYNKLAQVIQILSNQVYQQIYQAGQLSRIISKTNDEMIANIEASYQQTQQASDRVNANFSDYMRGVDRYSDGGTNVQLPSGYGHAWANDRGEYLLTNTAGYNPGTDLNGTWKELNKK
jgi:hypothetical protein